MSEFNSCWRKLNCQDSLMSCHKNIHVLNDNELLIVPRMDKDVDVSLWNYNINNNSFTKWFECPKDIVCKHQTSALNEDKTILYMFGELGEIITVDLKTGKFTVVNDERYHDGSHSKSLFINGQFHIFGGWVNVNKSHFIWNEEEKQLIEMYKFKEMKNIGPLHRHSVMYCASQNTVLIIHWANCTIYSYSLNTNECIQLPFEPSEHFKKYFEQAILTSNEQFVICFINSASEIDILDLKTLTLKKSKVSMPVSNGQIYLCLRSNKGRADKVTNGYIRKYFDFVLNFIPNDIIGIIQSFVCFEVIHLFNEESHLTINVDVLINEV
eukprot:165585_1